MWQAGPSLFTRTTRASPSQSAVMSTMCCTAAGGLPLPPQLLAGAAPEAGALLLDGDVQALPVHVGQGEHLAWMVPSTTMAGMRPFSSNFSRSMVYLSSMAFLLPNRHAHGDAVVPQESASGRGWQSPQSGRWRPPAPRPPRAGSGRGPQSPGRIPAPPEAITGTFTALAHGGQHLQVEAPFDPVGVDGVDHHFPGAPVHAAGGPTPMASMPVSSRPPLAKTPELAVHPLHVHGEDHALVAVPLGRLAR